MRLFRRKQKLILTFSLMAMESCVEKWTPLFCRAPYLHISPMETGYIESLMMVHLPYRLLETNRYEIVFYKPGATKEEVRREVYHHMANVTRFNVANPPGDTIIPAYFPPMAFEVFMKGVRFKGKFPSNSDLDIPDPFVFYEDHLPSIQSVDNYFNEGYM